MRFAIFGVGAVGGYFGARLAQAGEDVVFIAKGDTLRTLQVKGLRLESLNGDLLLPSVNVTDDVSRVDAVDVVLVGVKTWQVPDAAKTIAPLVGEDTFVLPLQNGVEATDQLAAELGGEYVGCGLAKIVSCLAAPGHIRHTGVDPYVAIGEIDNRRTERVERLRQSFQHAGIRAEIPPDMMAALWEKFLLVSSWGGIGAVSRAPIGVIRSLPQTRRMLEQAMREVLAVARARRISLEDDIITRTMDFIDTLPPGGTTSMQRDIAEGRPSELESWNGAVVRLGRQAGVAAAVHNFIYDSLLPLELNARGEMPFA